MAPFQVEKLTLKSSVATQYENPIETNRKGEITGIVLSVPVSTEKNAFLVVHIPQSSVQDLIRSTAARPEAQRAQFIRDWIKQNQLAIYDQYMSSGGKAMTFNYELVPLTKMAGLTPKPAEPAAKPRAIISRVEPPPTVFIQPEKKEIAAPQEKKAPIKEPPVAAKLPETKKETRTEPPPMPSYKAPEQTAPAKSRSFRFEPEQITGTRPQETQEKKAEGNKPPLIASIEAPPERHVIPIAPKAERIVVPPLPKTVVGGNGSEKHPYRIRLEGNRATDDIGGSAAVFPVRLKIPIEKSNDLIIMVNADLLLSQLRKGVRDTTQQQLFETCKGIILHYAAQNKKNVEDSTIRTTKDSIQMGISRIIETVMKNDPEVVAYLKK